MAGKDITLLIAHPDDEALFMWPFLDRVKRIVCASSDQSNLSRKWCSERGKCLAEVGELLDCEIDCGVLNSEFYRLSVRDGRLKAEMDALIERIGNPEILATHNAWGEYGHIDHLLMHHIGRTVQARTDCLLLTTDIAVTQAPAWLPIAPWKPADRWTEGPYYLDHGLFNRLKAIYDARGCWTWSFEPVTECRVHSLCAYLHQAFEGILNSLMPESACKWRLTVTYDDGSVASIGSLRE